MIVATRIPQLTDRLRAATIRAATQPRDDEPLRRMIEHLEARGYHVIAPLRAA